MQVKDVFLPWYNAYRFLVQNAKRLEVEGLAPFAPMDQCTLQNSSNVLDQWINSATLSLVHFVRKEMGAYRLYTVSFIQGKMDMNRELYDITDNYSRFMMNFLKEMPDEVWEIHLLPQKCKHHCRWHLPFGSNYQLFNLVNS